jgi:hypothetical protein
MVYFSKVGCVAVKQIPLVKCSKFEFLSTHQTALSGPLITSRPISSTVGEIIDKNGRNWTLLRLPWPVSRGFPG